MRGSAPRPARAPVPLIVEGTDFGTSVRVRLEVSPGTAGFNTFTATVTDYDTGAPVDGRRGHPALPLPGTVGRRQLAARPGADGRRASSAATGANLSLDGDLAGHRAGRPRHLLGRGPPRADDRASGSAGASPSRRSTSTPSPACRRSTPSTCRPAGRSRSTSIPGKPGANDVHVTFFDAAGNELPVASVTMALGPVGRTASRR